jgi:hypothetical protein
MARSSLCLLAVALCWLCGADAPAREARDSPNVQKTNVGVAYHRFLLLRCDGNVLALFLMPNPRHGWDGIVYHWFLLTDGSDRFFLPSPLESDRSPNPKVLSGAGETHEGDTRPGNGTIKAGPLSLDWSKGGLKSGWLYFADVPNKVEIYPGLFERLEDCSGQLDPKRWQTIKDKPQQGR